MFDDFIPTPQLVQTDIDLLALCTYWHNTQALALDTEFVRSRTYYPKLGLIQVADGTGVYLIDPLAIRDLTPFFTVLSNPNITKIYHACSEDIEVLYHLYPHIPTPIFDTQIACAFLGLGRNLGYAQCTKHFLGIDILKEMTRTPWLQRPLSPEQLRYAAADVVFLWQLYAILKQKILDKNWYALVLEESFNYAGNLIEPAIPEQAYLNIKHNSHLDPAALAVLREVAAWREREAIKRDLPRGFVIKNHVLLAIAQRKPRSLTELSLLPDMHPRTIQRHGQYILRLIQKALQQPKEQWPTPPQNFNIGLFKAWLKKARDVLDEISAKTGIPADVLSTTKQIQAHFKATLAGKDSPWEGWRRDYLEPTLSQQLQLFIAEHGNHTNHH